MKRLIVCCDGTWNKPDQRAPDGRPCPTNVYKVAVSVASADGAGHDQLVYYHPGVGTTRGEKFTGGAFGAGLSHNIVHAYRWLVESYEPGDVLYLFGFSRGAYTVRSLASLVRNSGILRREHKDQIAAAFDLYRDRDPSSGPREREATLFRRSFSHEAPIHFIGVWDTVGSLGVPYIGIGWTQLLNRRLRFHDVQLSSHVHGAFQALAIDEKRPPFLPAVWKRQPDAPASQVVEQVWFAGCHCDVGGGNVTTGLSDITLRWIAGHAHDFGLRFLDGPLYPWAPGGEQQLDEQLRFPLTPDQFGPISESRTGLYKLIPVASRRIGRTDPGAERLADSALHRHEYGAPAGPYAPPNLTAYLAGQHPPAVPVDSLSEPGPSPLPAPRHDVDAFTT